MGLQLSLIAALFANQILAFLTFEFFNRQSKLIFSLWVSYVYLVYCGIPILLPILPQPRISNTTIAIFCTIVGALLVGFALSFSAAASIQNRNWGRKWEGVRKLNTSGVYRLVRHPMYMSLTLAFLGWALIWRATYSLLCAPLFLLFSWMNAFWEERKMLLPQFAKEYEEYRKRAPMLYPRPVILPFALVMILLAAGIIAEIVPV